MGTNLQAILILVLEWTYPYCLIQLVEVLIERADALIHLHAWNFPLHSVIHCYWHRSFSATSSVWSSIFSSILGVTMEDLRGDLWAKVSSKRSASSLGEVLTRPLIPERFSAAVLTTSAISNPAKADVAFPLLAGEVTATVPRLPFAVTMDPYGLIAAVSSLTTSALAIISSPNNVGPVFATLTTPTYQSKLSCLLTGRQGNRHRRRTHILVTTDPNGSIATFPSLMTSTTAALFSPNNAVSAAFPLAASCVMSFVRGKLEGSTPPVSTACNPLSEPGSSSDVFVVTALVERAKAFVIMSLAVLCRFILTSCAPEPCGRWGEFLARPGGMLRVSNWLHIMTALRLSPPLYWSLPLDSAIRAASIEPIKIVDLPWQSGRRYLFLPSLWMHSDILQEDDIPPGVEIPWNACSRNSWHVWDYCLVWAKKVSLAAICLVAGSASFGIRIN